MTPRDVVRTALAVRRPPYTPWSFRFTKEAADKLVEHFGGDDLLAATGGHIVELGSDIGFFEQVEPHCYRDVFGVEWDRSIDRDIGLPRNQILHQPSLAGWQPPDPRDPRFFDPIPARLAVHGHRYRLYCIGFSLFERAWSLRGMPDLLMDFHDHPDFVHELFHVIADYNIAQVRQALRYDIDGVYFGDDWGQQHGLIMGYNLWKTYLAPALGRMYQVVRESGKDVWIHSCGDVDELFDDLIELGVNCFNPFQPEVMDVMSLMERYRGRLAFWGGLSTQKTLPYGTQDAVRHESRTLLHRGSAGGYIFSPAHAVEGDVPLANLLAFIDEAKSQVAAVQG